MPNTDISEESHSRSESPSHARSSSEKGEVETLTSLLTKLNLERYIQLFEKHKWDLRDALNADPTELEEALPKGPFLKLTNALNKIKQQLEYYDLFEPQIQQLHTEIEKLLNNNTEFDEDTKTIISTDMDQLSQLAKKSKETRLRLASNGTIATSIKLLNIFNTENIVVYALAFLEAMAKEAMHRSAIFKLDGIKPILNLLVNEKSNNIFCFSLKALRRIIIHGPALIEVQEASIVKKLVNIIQTSGQNEVVAPALDVLVQLTIYNDKIQEILCKSDLIDQVAGFMKNAKDLKIQAKSTALIGAIVSVPNTRPEKKNEWQTVIRSKINIEQLTQTLSSDIENDNLQAASLRTIDYLSMNKLVIQEEFYKYGVIEKIAALLHRGSNVVKEASALALRGLTRNSKSTSIQIQNAVRESGAMGDLTNMLLSEVQWLHTSALTALAEICHNNPGNQQMIIGAISMQHIAQHIARNREYETQYQAITLVKNLVHKERTRKQLFLHNTDIIFRLDDVITFIQSPYVVVAAKTLKKIFSSVMEKIPTKLGDA